MPAPAACSPARPPVGPQRVLRRATQTFLRLWPLRLAPAAPTRQVQLLALADILDDAVAAQSAADQAVTGCGGTGVVPVSVIQETADRITVYHHLIVRLRALRLASDLLPLGERASRLLAHHEWILNQALGLARAPVAQALTARQHLNGLGSMAHDLRSLRDDVRAFADRTSSEAERSCGEGPRHDTVVLAAAPCTQGMPCSRARHASGVDAAMIRLPEWPVWTRRPHAPRGEATQQALHDAEHVLREGLCALCRERDVGVHRRLTYVIAENHTDESVLARLKAAVGFCPAHTRYLLADASASWLMTRVEDAALRGGTRLLTDPVERPGPCPGCRSAREVEERALFALLQALDQPSVRQAVDDRGLCLPHLAALAARTDADRALRMTAVASVDLDEHPVETVRLAGMDPDASRRAQQLARPDRLLSIERAHQMDAVADRWNADLEVGCCPLCLAEQRAARRLQRRMAASGEERGGPGREETTLCPRHLHDLTAIGGTGEPAITAANQEVWLGRLDRFRRRLWEGREGRRSAGPWLTRAPRCRACGEEAVAGSRQLSLLSAELQNPIRARAYAYTHGVCLRHALTHGDALPASARSLLNARLAHLRWEVDEALREQDCHTRHEVKGAEMAVGHRAPTLLDGRVYAGLPAPHPDADADAHDQDTDRGRDHHHPDQEQREPEDKTAPTTRRTQWSSK